ncbi:SDR family oxidoreductase [Sphingobium sp.]|uniref:SDR family NAD(P)-dependent oxidoreductase n=1 Tax=Sphingobium sp. TaxID=1912891 RepID=UPI0028BF42D2|nr:SDR family oxidoreductase [Sphingobium sp.]
MTNKKTVPEFPQGVALIFGGSGGLGRSGALLMAERGSDIVITYNSRREVAEETVREIEAMGRKALALQCDVTDYGSVADVVKRSVEFGSRLHTVVTAGGLVFDTGPLIDFKPESFRAVIETDVFGFFNIARATVPHLRGQGGSIVALITSAVARTVPTDALSATPKAAVSMMVRHLAAEEARHNIRVNAIGPGVIDGGMVVALRETPAKDLLDMAVDVTPMGRLGTVDEIGEAIAFLASSRASYITGQLLMVDGGLSG